MMPQTAVLTSVALVPSLLLAQGDPGAALWRVAAQTLAVPPALTEGAGGALWNPAGAGDPGPAAGKHSVGKLATDELSDLVAVHVGDHSFRCCILPFRTQTSFPKPLMSCSITPPVSGRSEQREGTDRVHWLHNGPATSVTLN